MEAERTKLNKKCLENSIDKTLYILGGLDAETEHDQIEVYQGLLDKYVIEYIEVKTK